MKAAFGIILIVLFLMLSLLHFYWVFGGKKGLDKALPTDNNGKRVLHPGKIETSIVAIGLLLFASYYVLKIGAFEIGYPSLIFDFGGWIISAVFILRAIGEFKYVGYFKRIKNTAFGQLDTKYYSSLSLAIGILGIFVELI